MSHASFTPSTHSFQYVLYLNFFVKILAKTCLVDNQIFVGSHLEFLQFQVLENLCFNAQVIP